MLTWKDCLIFGALADIQSNQPHKIGCLAYGFASISILFTVAGIVGFILHLKNKK